MISDFHIKTCIWVIGFFSLAGAVPWIPPSLEALDEIHDAEIYKAVVTSVNDWKRKQELKKFSNRTKREDTSVCYSELGCFEASGPFGYLDMLPGKPEEINTKFLLYPGRNRRRSGSPPAEVPFDKLNDAFEWAKQGFNRTLPTKVLIHGFGSDCSYIWIYEIRSALMGVEEVNIICVDWSNGATLPNYVKATANTRLVGKQVSLLLRGLVEHNGLSLRNTHLIGFSLGAHIAGFAGADLGNLSRITGLDPAGPLFESQDTRARLDQTDAGFVDVIHSNGENLILGGLGTSQPMGHVDFYPNGGRMQKGCSHLFVGAVSDIIWSSAVEGRSLCNHRRAYKFFIDSVSPRCHFPAFPCESYEDFLAGKCFPCSDERTCGNMGYYADRSKGKGQLYLVTRDEEPFCAHQYLVKIETSPSAIPIKSYGKIQITLIGDSLLNETFMMTRKDDEEMKLGESISRILVPHPILSQPTRIEILYTAYSGWLSSGLTQWRIDKVTLMDSFRKMSSVCKKSLILESGVPVILPLYPGECNLPKETFNKEAEDRMQDVDNKPSSSDNFTKETGFIPTQVVRIGLNDEENKKEKPGLSLKSAIEIFNIPWRNEKENNIVDSEAESSRAFNTRIIKADSSNIHQADSDGLIKEIVEPILKPHSYKNARSHDPKKESEITEPILGPTTAKSSSSSTTEARKTGRTTTKGKRDNQEATYEFYDDSWVPQVKRNGVAKSARPPRDELSPLDAPLEALANTVQFLPQRLARMFEQAEQYARETILPLVSTYTPKFIADIIAPREKPKYVPLHFEDESPTSTSKASDKSTTTVKNVISTNPSESRSLKTFDPPPKILEEQLNAEGFTTPYTHIQKISKTKEKNEEFHTTTTVLTVEEKTPTPKEVSRRARDDVHVNKISRSATENVPASASKTTKAIYIDLPVFDSSEREMKKYIPLSYD